MTHILILGTTEETVENLDNKTLEEMTRTIARAVCNVHYENMINKVSDLNDLSKEDKDLWKSIPMVYFDKIPEWTVWAMTSIENYNKLIDLGFACCKEHRYRYRIHNFNTGYLNILRWARENQPTYLPMLGEPQNFSTITSERFRKKLQRMDLESLKNKFNTNSKLIAIYRCYYQSKIDKEIKKYKNCDFLQWSLRSRPEWLTI